VAIKVLRPHLLDDPVSSGRFIQEYRILTTISHANIVRLFDLVVEGDTMAIVMEWVPYGDLQGSINSFNQHEVSELAAGLVDGLQAIHSMDVIHRDLKPANVLLDRSSSNDIVPKISDFGIARLTDSSLTRTATVIGTPLYLAPESLEDGKSITHRADIYSLGTILFELLSGKPPFHEGNPLAIMRAHAEKRPAKLTNVDPALADLVDSMLRKRPTDRPALSHISNELQAINSRLRPEPPTADSDNGSQLETVVISPLITSLKAPAPPAAATARPTAGGVAPAPTGRPTTAGIAPAPTLRGPHPAPTALSRPKDVTPNPRFWIIPAIGVGCLLALFALFMASRGLFDRTSSEETLPVGPIAQAATPPTTFPDNTQTVDLAAGTIAIPTSIESPSTAYTALALVNEIRSTQTDLSFDDLHFLNRTEGSARALLANTDTNEGCCGAILSTVFTESGEGAVTGGSDGKVLTWDLASGSSRTLGTARGAIWSVDVSWAIVIDSGPCSRLPFPLTAPG